MAIMEYKDNYAQLITSTDIHVIMKIFQNATDEEKQYHYEQSQGIITANAEESVTGAGEIIGGAAVTGAAATGGGVAASILGATTATTTTGGIFGFFATTAVTTVAAPAVLVAGAAAGAGLLGYGAYKLISGSAKLKGKEEHFKEVKEEGRYHIGNAIRKLNPYIWHKTNYDKLCQAYTILQACPSTNKNNASDFLRFFDSDNFIEVSTGQFANKLDTYLANLKNKYKTENKNLINSCAAFMDVNNEFTMPRLLQGEEKEKIEAIQKGLILIDNRLLVIEQEWALFHIYKMLLNHPQNTESQRKLQQEKMYQRAKELGAKDLFKEVLAEKRPIKLDETNYIRYLKEVVGVLDDDVARNFISDLVKDITECMLVDDVMEEYEQNIVENLNNTFGYLLNTK